MATTSKSPQPKRTSAAVSKPSSTQWARGKIAEVFGADLRSLAALRVVLALLVLADLALRATDFYAHYTDDGVLPREQLLAGGLLDTSAFSFAFANGQPLFMVLLFGATALAALSLLVGYRTRLSTVVVWVLLMSIQWRNPLLMNGGDTLLRLLLFWGMFVPLGAYWSLDHLRRAPSRRPAMLYFSLGTVGLFMQIAFVYVFTVILKSGDEWRVDGTALYYALQLDQLVTPFGAFLAQFPNLLKAMTFGTLGLEAFGPLLLFIPFFIGPVRTAVVLAFMSLHYGIWMSMELGLFPWISSFCMVCFLPSWFWDNAGDRLNAAFPKLSSLPQLVQRSLAGLIRAPIFAFAHRSPLATTFAASSSEDSMAHEGAPDDHTQHADADATRPSAIHRAFGGPSRPGRLRASVLTNVLAAFFLAYIFFWNLQGVTSLDASERVENVGAVFGLHQQWSMFAPQPPKIDGWYVILGTLRGGQEVDLMPVTRDDFSMYSVSYEKPLRVADTYETNHWRKYMERAGDEDYPDDVRLSFGNYLCDEWNARHEGSEQLVSFEVVHMVEETLPNYREAEPQRDFLYDLDCF